MSNVEGSVRVILAWIEALDGETLEPGQKEAALKAVRELRQAIRAGQFKKVHRAINKIAKIFQRLDS